MSDMPRCATCKHWERFDLPAESVYVSNDRNSPDYRRLIKVDVGENDLPWGECAAPSSPSAAGHSRLFQVWDASRYAASLSTRDTFGCVEHTPRTEESPE